MSSWQACASMLARVFDCWPECVLLSAGVYIVGESVCCYCQECVLWQKCMLLGGVCVVGRNVCFCKNVSLPGVCVVVDRNVCCWLECVLFARVCVVC